MKRREKRMTLKQPIEPKPIARKSDEPDHCGYDDVIDEL